METKVVLVDEHDNETGTEEKMRAHQNGGKLHRAFSIFVFNSKGETMLQKRAATKYHGAGLWSNTTCSHPNPGESVLDAAHRRLREEMGFDCDMKEAFEFVYEADMGNGLTEHEYDHIVFGNYDARPKLNRDEASDWKWMTLESLAEDLKKNPKSYSPWLKLAMARVIRQYNKMQHRA